MKKAIAQTPMMRQYQKIKQEYQDCLLLYRMGDFYELFLEDAHIGSKILNITLTSKSNGKNEKIPMAGVPYHAVDSYLAKLVKAGYKVAICEQVSLPNKYGLVDREVVRVVTPGTILDEKFLEKKENNYILSLDISDTLLAISYADISTGFLGAYEVSFDNLEQSLKEELAKISPTECILPESLYNDPEFLKHLKSFRGLNIFPYPEWATFADDAQEFLTSHFHVKTLDMFDVKEFTLALETSAALLGYLRHTQKSSVSHIKKITHNKSSEYLLMDRSTMINLELFSTIREHDTTGSLLHVIDRTLTSMGGRMLKRWMKNPLVQKNALQERYDAVEDCLKNKSIREDLDSILGEIPDIERILSRLSVNNGNARDLIHLQYALLRVLAVKKKLKSSKSVLLQKIYTSFPSSLTYVIDLINKNILEEPSIGLHDGNIIKAKVDKELDSLRRIVGGSRDWMKAMEETERKKTGINSLKIRFNKIFGFYIEVSKPNLHLVPKTYIRKQTMVNGERFITKELKHHEEIILTAEEKIKALEYTLFQEILSNVLVHVADIQTAAESLGELDCILNFAHLAEKENYTRPTLLTTGEMNITGGRHPVVESLLAHHQFVPNDVSMNTSTQQLLIITGPNMAGKSVFIRQVAITVLLAQMGCFVPAQKAEISIVDRIFVRSGASDIITSGLSTFMVEMVETAYILHHATKNSLIVMDEIGRGTSTYDGISIARAVAEYLVTHSSLSPKTLFATHYHELQTLEQEYPSRIKNYHMAIAHSTGSIDSNNSRQVSSEQAVASPVFLYTLAPGGASHSYGVAVAKLAGIPEEVINRAQEILKMLEARTPESSKHIEYKEPLMAHHITDRFLHKELEHIDISHMTPLQALNKLSDLKEKIKLFSSSQLSQEID